MDWVQVYDPLHSPWLSTLCAVLPLVVLLTTLAWLEWRAYLSAAAGLGVALIVTIAVFGMPVPAALAAAGYGAAYGFLPIGWIVVNASSSTTSRSRPDSSTCSDRQSRACRRIVVFKRC